MVNIYITFKGKTNEDMGVKILDIDAPSRAESYMDVITIPARPSPMVVQREDHSSYDITATMRILYETDIHQVYAWLSGSGKLIISDRPDLYYICYACSPISAKRIGAACTITELTVKFTVMPFAYACDNEPITVTTSPFLFKTAGTYYSEPVYEITGSGDITLQIGSANDNAYISIPSVTNTVYVDVARMQVYTIGTAGEKISILPMTSGFFERMVLVPSETSYNRLSWSGNVTRVRITKNERWL